jgi:hypothetical protein
MIVKVQKEVRGEALKVPADLLIQPAGGYAIDLGQISVEQYTLPADHANDSDKFGRRLR